MSLSLIYLYSCFSLNFAYIIIIISLGYYQGSAVVYSLFNLRISSQGTIFVSGKQAYGTVVCWVDITPYPAFQLKPLVINHFSSG